MISALKYIRYMYIFTKIISAFKAANLHKLLTSDSEGIFRVFCDWFFVMLDLNRYSGFGDGWIK